MTDYEDTYPYRVIKQQIIRKLKADHCKINDLEINNLVIKRIWRLLSEEIVFLNKDCLPKIGKGGYKTYPAYVNPFDGLPIHKTEYKKLITAARRHEGWI